MKESEAKKKWCPLTRVIVDAEGYGSGNRFQDAPHYQSRCQCIGSDCMMWEDWTKREYAETEYYEGDSEIPPPEGDGWKHYGVPQRTARPTGPVDIRQHWVRDVSSGYGDCGLKSKECGQ